VNATFKTPQEAHTWYHETKAEYVKQVASDALQAGEIQQDVYEALINRTYHEAEHARRCSAQLWAEPTPRIAAEQTLALAINTNDMATIDAQLEMLASSDWTEEELQQYSQEHGDA
jgi:3'-phosphoadenosine 5'-phosphosulfate sulfotransferase (PAPS reductase)/FAD synthetase